MKPVKPTSPTTSGINALLKRHGLFKSEAQATRIRGYKSITTGFKVQKPNTGKAFAMVSYNYAVGDRNDSYEQMMLRITELCEAAGFRVVRGSWMGDPMPNGPYLCLYEKEPADVQQG